MGGFEFGLDGSEFFLEGLSLGFQTGDLLFQELLSLEDVLVIVGVVGDTAVVAFAQAVGVEIGNMIVILLMSTDITFVDMVGSEAWVWDAHALGYGFEQVCHGIGPPILRGGVQSYVLCRLRKGCLFFVHFRSILLLYFPGRPR